MKKKGLMTEDIAFSHVGQAVRDYCFVMGIVDDDRLDNIYEQVIDLLVKLTDPIKQSSKKIAGLSIRDKFVFPIGLGYVQWEGQMARIVGGEEGDQWQIVLDEMWPEGSQTGTGIWVNKGELAWASANNKEGVVTADQDDPFPWEGMTTEDTLEDIETVDIEGRDTVQETLDVEGSTVEGGKLDGFWENIDAQIEQLRSARSADDVIRILGPVDREYGTGDAFFMGGGGDQTVYGALMEAGWKTAWFDAPYYFAMEAPDGSGITYVEGDIYRGVQEKMG